MALLSLFKNITSFKIYNNNIVKFTVKYTTPDRELLVELSNDTSAGVNAINSLVENNNISQA